MLPDNILNTIKNTVNNYLPDARVILFGSHARVEQCSLFDAVFNNIEIYNINKFAVDSRYPDLSDLPELDEANKYYYTSRGEV